MKTHAQHGPSRSTNAALAIGTAMMIQGDTQQQHGTSATQHDIGHHSDIVAAALATV